MAQLSSSTPTGLSSAPENKNKYLIPFILVASLFFLWGMVHNLDSILIPHLKKACELNNRQSTLIDTSIFLAYFLMALPAGIFLKKWGYKKSIVGGLLVAACGAFLFYPAAEGRNFPLFLFALFVIGCGIAVLETAANPYATILGKPETAGIRLNLAQAINGVAVFVAPLVGTLFILSGKEYSKDKLAAMPDTERIAYLSSESHSVIIPYLALCGCLVVVALLFFLFRFPEVKSESKSVKFSDFKKVLRHKHLRWAVLAQFVYVGAQVCFTSFFIRTAQQVGGMDEKTSGYYLSTVYGLLFLGGRFSGTFLLKYVRQQKLLTYYAIACALLSIAAMLVKGQYVVYCLGGVGFFMSIMFPTIFSLGIKDLGEDTEIGSSLLIMSIIGGAIFPFLMATIIDLSSDNIQRGYIVPLLCFLVVIYFAIKGHKVREQHKVVQLD